jgi:DNA-binding LytR/AlgR family response regulator
LNTKLKCLLLDDELPGLTYLKMLCSQIEALEVVKAFDNPIYFLEDLPNLEYDLCILDIEMPGINGLQLAGLMKGKPVIFATAHSDYAAEAFDLNAVDFIRKPIKLDRLEQAVKKAGMWITQTTEAANPKKYLQVNSDKGKALLFYDTIQYIRTSEIDSRDKWALLSDGESVLIKNMSFEKLLENLPKSDFSRINKQEVIHLRTVQFFSYDELTTTIRLEGRNLKLTLSEAYRNEFLKRVRI